jgi:hypothetical protein
MGNEDIKKLATAEILVVGPLFTLEKIFIGFSTEINPSFPSTLAKQATNLHLLLDRCSVRQKGRSGRAAVQRTVSGPGRRSVVTRQYPLQWMQYLKGVRNMRADGRDEKQNTVECGIGAYGAHRGIRKHTWHCPDLWHCSCAVTTAAAKAAATKSLTCHRVPRP